MSPANKARLRALADLGLFLLGLAALLALAVGFAVAGRLPTSQFALAALTAGQMLVFLGLATALMAWRGEHWPGLGLRPPASWRRTAGLVATGYLAVILASAAIQLILVKGMKVEAPDLQVFGAIKGNPRLYLFWLAVAWLSAAVGEELLFRGFVWSRLERLVGGLKPAPVAALALQALLFGAGHAYQGLTGVLVTTILGLVLGAVYLAGKRNLVACILLHGLIDTISLTALYFGVTPEGF